LIDVHIWFQGKSSSLQASHAVASKMNIHVPAKQDKQEEVKKSFWGRAMLRIKSAIGLVVAEQGEKQENKRMLMPCIRATVRQCRSTNRILVVSKPA
jgi:hypothetical protein